MRHQKTGIIKESLRGIVDRVTYHNRDTGYSVLRVTPFDSPHQQETVIVFQTKVFAGATMEFMGNWTVHKQFGRQFQATEARELKPATTAALEKYLGSGLIKGVGPKTAEKIVRHFKERTLEIFESEIERLTEVEGIAHKKLEMIKQAWIEHRAIRRVMMFLQSHGISTLFAVRIYKEYGDEAINLVNDNPYRLANDFYGIGFFSADKVALSIGLAPDSRQRIMAAVAHVLASSRDFGHCYLTRSQIKDRSRELLDLDLESQLSAILAEMENQNQLKLRELTTGDGISEPCYYSKSLFYDELYVANRIGQMAGPIERDRNRISDWINRYCKHNRLKLSEEQSRAVAGIVCESFSILTGGPGCGKTTTTRVLVGLLEAMGVKVMLAAPTGRAAQRMSEVIGREARTIHRMLEWQMRGFKKNEDDPLDVQFLVIDECSMLDINLSAALLKAVPKASQLLFIGDPDQLPSVGAGNVMGDIIASDRVPCFRLTKVFRQARESLIIRYAHLINAGEIPHIQSPFKKPGLWNEECDCLFVDSEEATNEQLLFINRVKKVYDQNSRRFGGQKKTQKTNPFEFRTGEQFVPYETEIVIPRKFAHVDLEKLAASSTGIEELLHVLDKVHPWSSLRYGLSAVDVVTKLYLEWIPKYFGSQAEIQILSPMTRGSLGTLNLNNLIQQYGNPAEPGKGQLKAGEWIFRVGDRVIHRRNNYDLGVFNGDIGVITDIDAENLSCWVSFFPDGRVIEYRSEHIVELNLAYAITIHKSQGSEFETVIIPLLTQHFKMLFRNLLYTGVTRARKLAVFVGTRKALAMAVRNRDTTKRQTTLQQLLQNGLFS